MPQLAVMAAIVATMLLAPVAALLALLCHALFGVGWRAFFTFGGSVGSGAGVLAWWAIVFVPSLVYSAFAMPWTDKG